MNTNSTVSLPVAADLSAYSDVAVKLTSTGIALTTSITDRVIGTMIRGNLAPQVGQSAVGMSASVFLAFGNGFHWVTLGAGIATAIAMGDELELDTTDGTYCLRTNGVAAAIAVDPAPATQPGGKIRAILLPPVSPTAGATAGAVTQITSATTTVVSSALSGAITTVAQNIAAAGEASFTVTNTRVAAGDVPVVAIASGSTGGTTIASVTAVAAGSFVITLTNLHASVAETGTLVINYFVNKAAI